jgi:hypothetical protein
MNNQWKRVAATLVLAGGTWLGLALAAPAVATASSYVALGDSYTAGDGTRVYYDDGSRCYRSPDAYPPLVAAAEGDTLSFEACSGATTADVIANQLAALSAATSLVTVQVGGDDAGFSTVGADCAVFYFPCQKALQTADAFIEGTLPGRLETTYADISADAYPLGFDSVGTRCGLNVLTPPNELAANATVGLLDGVIESAAAAQGFTFVDPRPSFSSHELCSSTPWINNITLPVIATFHPNIAGEADFAELVEGAL